MPKPNYGLPVFNRQTTVQWHDAEINRCLAAIWDAAVVANLDGPAAEALMEEFRDLWDDIQAWATQVAADAADIRSRLNPPIVVLAEGQSNFRTIPEQIGGDLTVNPSVLAWNSQAAPMADGTAWVTATPGQNPFIGTAGANNAAWQFCKELQRRTGRKVYLILAALGSHSIEAFMNASDLTNNGWTKPAGDADLFTFVMAQLAAALPLVPGAPTSVDYLLWHQGEANKEDQVEVYAKKLRTVLKRFELNGRIVRNKTEIIAGELLVGANNGRYRERHLNALRRLQMGTREDAFPRFKIARSTGLQPVTINDDLHFSGEDLTALGKRYADAAFTEQVPAEMDPVSCDLSVDGGLGWATGLVAAQTHKTYSRREPVYLADTTITIEDNATLGWCYVAPQNVTTNLPARKIYRVDPYAQFLMSIEARNDHPTDDGSFSLAVLEYDAAMAYLTLNVMTAQTIAPGTTARFWATFGHSGNGRTNHRSFGANARYFSPIWRFNPAGTGAGVRFNLPNPRWI
ncbi:MAG: sialate O-acetylesterase [Alphaproteobacteria bacterium]|nr:sialate O-acetylesterase [Alphaproteobacteria bacterium]